MIKVQVEDKDINEDSIVSAMSDVLFNFAIEKYMIKWKVWNTKEDYWTETNAMIFKLVPQHCAKVL